MATLSRPRRRRIHLTPNAARDQAEHNRSSIDRELGRPGYAEPPEGRLGRRRRLPNLLCGLGGYRIFNLRFRAARAV
jgi:hypothetical protein